MEFHIQFVCPFGRIDAHGTYVRRLHFFEMMQARSQRMLIERIDSRGVARGYGENYVPVILNAKGIEKNTFINIRLGEIVNRGNEEKMAFIGKPAT